MPFTPPVFPALGPTPVPGAAATAAAALAQATAQFIQWYGGPTDPVSATLAGAVILFQLSLIPPHSARPYEYYGRCVMLRDSGSQDPSREPQEEPCSNVFIGFHGEKDGADTVVWVDDQSQFSFRPALKQPYTLTAVHSERRGVRSAPTTFTTAGEVRLVIDMRKLK